MPVASVLILLVVTTVLLATERLRADLVALLVLGALVVLRLLEPSEVLSGFSNPATVTVACMFVLSAGLQASGVVQYLGDRLLRHGPSGEAALLALIILAVTPVSAFVNNTAAVAVFLPLVLRACEARHLSPSHVMMPLSFFAMLGGTCTLIGTSTNILVSSIAEDHGLRPFGMFEFTALGLLLLLVGGVYLITVGRKMLPERVPAESPIQGFNLNHYLSELIVMDDSPLVGKTLAEARLAEQYDMEVLTESRDDVVRSVPGGYGTLLAGDTLLVKAGAGSLVQLRTKEGLALKSEQSSKAPDLHSADSALVEIVIKPNSGLEGRTVKTVDFRNRFGATALAIRRHGEDIREKIGRIRLRVGDELLVLVSRQSLARLRAEASFVVLEELEVPMVKPRQAIAACLIVLGVVLGAALGPFAIVETAVVGSVLMVLSGCLPARKLYQNIDWSVIFLLGGLLPLGLALESSGAAALLVDYLLSFSRGLAPTVVLGLLFAVTSLLTGFMSNTAAAALLAPLAIATAASLGLSPRPFLIAVALAASAAFFTPVGYQTNLLVNGPGGYRFMDFVRVGGPLTILYWITATLLIPRFFPFAG